MLLCVFRWSLVVRLVNMFWAFLFVLLSRDWHLYPLPPIRSSVAFSSVLSVLPLSFFHLVVISMYLCVLERSSFTRRHGIFHSSIFDVRTVSLEAPELVGRVVILFA